MENLNSIQISSNLLVVSSDSSSSISMEEHAEETGSANLSARDETAPPEIVIINSSSESERAESDDEILDGAEEVVGNMITRGWKSELRAVRHNPSLYTLRENTILPAARRNPLTIRRNAALYRRHMDSLERRNYLRSILSKTSETGGNGAISTIHESHMLSASENLIRSDVSGNRDNSVTRGRSARRSSALPGTRRTSPSRRRNAVPFSTRRSSATSTTRRYSARSATRRYAASYRQNIVFTESLHNLRSSSSRTPALATGVNGVNSNTRENWVHSTRENSPVLLTRIPRDDPASSATCGTSTRENTLRPVVSAVSENPVVFGTHENSARPTTSGSSAQYSRSTTVESSSDESDTELGFNEEQPLESRSSKRARLSNVRNLAQVVTVTDVMTPSASNNASPVVMGAEDDVEVLNVEPAVVPTAVVEATGSIVAGIQTVERASESEAAPFLRPLLPIVPDRTNDFQHMNRRMQVLERSMRYVAAQIVAMTANRPSPVNMRLWAQQQYRAEQERMRSMAQTGTNFPNNSNGLTEMQARAHLQLHINSQLQAQTQAQAQEQADVQPDANAQMEVPVDTHAQVDAPAEEVESNENSVRGLSEHAIREHLANHTDEFAYNSFSLSSTRESKCIICYEDFEKGAHIRRLRCNHCFHRRCIDQWFTTSQLRCPTCRANVIENSYEVD